MNTLLSLQGVHGGTGVTTVLAALGQALHVQGLRVLLVECSPDQMLGLHLGLPAKEAGGWARAQLDGGDWRASAFACASAGSSASFTPPALPRPPVLTCALTTTGPPNLRVASWAAKAWVHTSPGVTGTPCFPNRCLAWYSYRSTRTPCRPRKRNPNY